MRPAEQLTEWADAYTAIAEEAEDLHRKGVCLEIRSRGRMDFKRYAIFQVFPRNAIQYCIEAGMTLEEILRFASIRKKP